MKYDWRGFKSPDEVRAAVEQALPVGSPDGSVREFALEQGIECSAPTDGIIYCSAPARSKLSLTKAKWLLRIHVSGGRVDRVEAELGLTGP